MKVLVVEDEFYARKAMIRQIKKIMIRMDFLRYRRHLMERKAGNFAKNINQNLS